jgi:hypothetical protein
VRRAAAAALAVLCTIVAGSARAQLQPRAVARFALVIGSNQPPAGAQVPVLRYADDDAIAFHQLLGEAGLDSTLLVAPDPETEEQWPSLVHRAPTLAELGRSAAELATKARAARSAGQKPELLVFYSGHGDVDEDNAGYVVLSDGRLTRARLHALLTQVGAEHNHIIIDACKSYFLAFERGPGGWRTPYVGAPLARAIPSDLPNTGFVLSTSHSGVSHEWEHYRAGVVSYELRSALRGAADVDHNGVVTYSEIGAFVSTANQRLPVTVRPDVLLQPPQGHPTLLQWPDPPSVELDASSWGHVYIETASAHRLLDTHPQQGQTTRLWLPAQRPAFVRQHDESRELIIEQTELAHLEPSAGIRPNRTSKGAIGLAFERELFSVPFGAGDVQAYRFTPPSLQLELLPKVDAPWYRSASPELLWTGAASTVVLAAVGVGLQLAARGELKDTARWAQTCNCNAEQLEQRQSMGRTFETISWLSLGAAGLVGATTLTLFLLKPSSHSPSPRVSLGLGTVQLSGAL